MKKRKLWKKYNHAWVLLYALIYMPWFCYLEQRTNVHYYYIKCALDYLIPFNRYFIVPYYLWFVFVGVTGTYFFFTDKKGFQKLAAFLITGMTLFLLVSTFYPTALHLRPLVVEGNDIFAQLVRLLYRLDTPTNVFPSIHVYNSLGCLVAISNSEKLQKKRYVIPATRLMTVLIILSTLFLKQHSIIDVFGACILALVMRVILYGAEEYNRFKIRIKTGKRRAIL